MDSLDLLLLNELSLDSRQSFRALAKKLGVSPATVVSHTKELEKKGIIRGYSVKIDYDKLGFDLIALIEMKIDKGKLFEVEKRIASKPNACSIYDITGDTDSLIIAKFKNRRSLDAFVKDLQKMDFVQRTSTRLVLNTIKEENLKFSGKE
ncbi:MAG: Lrp/AsnC family transcriptional regulator [Candidatus Diapherotrites archaeon]|nr:Lrp/AsnC family transcriptional regulator [Candidatus Diapherotrites archaeon]